MTTLTKTLKASTLFVLSLCILLPGTTVAQRSYVHEVVPQEIQERLKEIYAENGLTPKTFRGTWLPDASGYIVQETVPGQNHESISYYDVLSGERTELVSQTKFKAHGYTSSFTIDHYSLSPGGEKILVQLSGKDNNKPEHWIVERKTGAAKKVEAGTYNSISPDGGHILYANGGNLFIYDIANEKTTQLTADENSGPISNGRASWSPDGTKILFVQSDASGIRKRSSLIPGDPTYPEVREQTFARIGGTIHGLRVGVVDAHGKETRWLSIPAPKEGYYLGQVSWAGNSQEVLVEKRSRFRDNRQFLIANASDGRVTNIYEESDPAWVVASYDINGGVDWLRNHRNFIVLTEKDGWRHAYLCSRDGKKEILLTPGNYDVIGRVGVDESRGWLYYYASPDNGTQKYLYRVRLDGKGSAVRITPTDQPGTHDYSLSPDGKWAFHTYSTANSVPVTELISLPEHKVARVLEDNKALREKIKSRNPQPKEFITIDIGDGIVMDAWMIKPSNFDPSRKYPVFIYVYGEPHAQTVVDSWGHAMADYHRVIADLGYLVVSFDNRGTPCPKGAAWRRVIAGSLGPLSTEEQAAAIQEFGRTRPYVDLSRVGIWGWSGGGSNTLNAMFRKPGVYNVGIAVAPKPQPHLYNAWFQEIYMNTPETNPEGYRRSAPINFAEGLEGDLLIVHGSGETNTHIQITEGLVDKLIELGKQFDYMVYPERDHGIREGKGTPLHLRIHMARYLLTHLPAGPR